MTFNANLSGCSENLTHPKNVFTSLFMSTLLHQLVDGDEPGSEELHAVVLAFTGTSLRPGALVPPVVYPGL